jgi:hypothetical protein
LAQPLLPFFDLFLHLAVAQCNFKESARGLFRNCGIEVTDEDNDIDYEELETDESREDVECDGVNEGEV